MVRRRMGYIEKRESDVRGGAKWRNGRGGTGVKSTDSVKCNEQDEIAADKPEGMADPPD